MVTLLVALAVLGILFGAAALATYDGDVLRDPHPDDRPAVLPTTALQPEDVSELRFDIAVRGYRMSEVDAALQRVAQELADRDARIAELEDALSEPAAEQPAPLTDAAVLQVPATPEPEPEPELVAPEEFTPLEPPAAAPAVASGPLTATTWWADDPTTTHEPVEPVEAPTAAADEPAQEQPVEPASADEAPAEPADASVSQHDAAAPAGQPHEAPQEQQADEETAALDVPETVPEPPALTLPAADDAFSFPELQPPDRAVEEPLDAQEPVKDWWTSLREPPSGGGPDRG
ncbi:MAG: DivIVA domain protein [Frankiales bacterium]|nr:DivIVA domain protein [Frankiales bacterium]